MRTFLAQAPAAYISSDQFRQSMRLLAGGVCIVATAHEGTRLGLTATSVCSLTLDPPMIVVCVNRDAGAHATMLETRRISVSFLGADQLDLARRFASTDVRGSHRFDQAWNETPGGMPALEGALAVLDCEITCEIPVGQHSVFLCAIRSARLAPGRSALVHFDRQFCGLSAIS